MLTNSIPETSPGFADVDMGASAAGYTVHKIFRRAGEMIADGEGAFRASYIGEGLVYRKYVCCVKSREPEIKSAENICF